MLTADGLKPFQNGGVDHGHLRSGARFGAHQPASAKPMSVAIRHLGQLTISLIRRLSPVRSQYRPFSKNPVHYWYLSGRKAAFLLSGCSLLRLARAVLLKKLL